jgi:hypothetical protein
MSVTDELLRNNDAYVAAFTGGDLPMPPASPSPCWPAWTPA